MGASARDQFDDDDDDVYSQPVDDHITSASNSNNGSITSTSNNYCKPPLIPSRMKKVSSVSSVEMSNNSNEYITMPPSRLREMVDGQNNLVSSLPAPCIPPKPVANRSSSTGTNSPPPPLFPR